MLTFFKWYQEWLIDCDYEPSQQQKDAMEDAWNGAIETMKESAQQSVEPTASRIKAGDDFSYMLSQQVKKD